VSADAVEQRLRHEVAARVGVQQRLGHRRLPDAERDRTAVEFEYRGAAADLQQLDAFGRGVAGPQVAHGTAIDHHLDFAAADAMT